MKIILKLLFCLILFSSAKCRNEDPCHTDVVVINNSNDSIIWAVKAHYDTLCNLVGPRLKISESYSFHDRYCWEYRLDEGEKEEFFIVDPLHYNEDGVYYDCDSIEIYNLVLYKFSLSLDDLIEQNFIITYPE